METTPIGFPPLTMAVFVGLALAALLLDMVTHRDDKPITLARASIWSVFWVAISLAFAGFLYVQHGAEVASLFLTGYALEKVLSVDNLFVFMAIFAWFKVPDGMRHRILHWGIIGAIVFRGVFVVIGTGLLAFGPWVEIVFALIVAWTAVMMLKGGDDDDEEKDYSQHLACRFAKKLFPVWPRLHGHNFFVSRKTLEAEVRTAGNDKSLAAKGNLFATPLFLCLVVIEVSDVLFAFDSVPAVIAVSREPLIVYSAMLFAILGLRTLYFVLEALKRYVVHLEKAVIVLLFFIAAKLGLNATDHLFHHGISISPNTSLLIVLIVLAIGILASVIFPKKEEAQAENQ
ncbi:MULTISPECIES: TerC/Alx family metal homeostasis membrane protein [Burkholderia]|uniref:Tellurium resistance protein TerC n=1 Tax=Burkholderia lata (strain ATCC 17760 / DSM 23089 / LMG 22485 / NCIMB 9086 / R18194 / 383) TaxID=482957 RepID=A0A6P2LCU7_BURL3|nr:MULTISPECIES: TerC/Alx family metal homeostasis membrane protein [Burkholderia]MBN3796469.1 TerC/Alx family metal homeostasis membrane protein [Burkholderia sp. Ac-20392]MBN3771545.1 TerC/Alx family metal homeostasis membrane protein [Burkholderia sp. Se-20378]VWB67867.1 tellurium resistance protein TerC [Burkholderia lata]VWB80088.1 tellurium resistance protein TerC [Burkholderia lata]VWM16155.1 tellurium resistance protein TerC [Burkholderia lata]